jgi:hypothetical protein
MADQKQHKRGERGQAARKLERLNIVRRMLYEAPEGLTTATILEAIKQFPGNERVSSQLVLGWLKELGAVKIERGLYTLIPTDEEAELARLILMRYSTAKLAAKAKQRDDHPAD